MRRLPPVLESAINLVAEGTRLEGKLRFEQVSRVHGTLVGEVEAGPGSTLVIAETGCVEGNVSADILLVDGFVRGDIVARTRVSVSGTGRVIGNIRAPKVSLDFGAWFEGRCSTGTDAGSPAPGPDSGASLSPGLSAGSA